MSQKLRKEATKSACAALNVTSSLSKINQLQSRFCCKLFATNYLPGAILPLNTYLPSTF